MSSSAPRAEFREQLGRQENIVVYRSPLGEWRKMLLFVASCILVNMLSVTFPSTLWTISLVDLGEFKIGFMVPVLGVFPLVILVGMLHQLYDVRYVIGLDSVMKVTGVLSFTTRTSKIFFQNVRGTESEQGPVERFFGVGDLKISAIASDSGDIDMKGVRNPLQYKGVLERRMLLLARAQQRSAFNQH